MMGKMMKSLLNRKVVLSLGALGMLGATLLSSAALAHDRDDYRDRNRNWNNNRIQSSRVYYRPAPRAKWFGPKRVAYLPGNRWGYYKNRPAPRRSWW